MGTEREHVRAAEEPPYIALPRKYVGELGTLLAAERAARAAEAVAGVGTPSELALNRARERVEACRRLPREDRMCQHVGLAGELQEAQEAIAVEVTSRWAWLQEQEVLAAAELVATYDAEHRAARRDFELALARVEGLLGHGGLSAGEVAGFAREVVRTQERLTRVHHAAVAGAARSAELFASEGSPAVRDACRRLGDLERPLRRAVLLRYVGTEQLTGRPRVSAGLPSEGTVLEFRRTVQLACFHVHKLSFLDGAIALVDAHDVSAAGLTSGQHVCVEGGSLVAVRNS